MFELKILSGVAGLTLLTAIVVAVNACKPIRDFQRPTTYTYTDNFSPSYPNPNKELPNVILIADNQGTEIFDLLGPFFLLSQTKKANVFIVSEQAEPVPLFRGLSVLPHHTFSSFSELGMEADLIVIPNLSTIDREQINPEIVSFIKSQYLADRTIVLSVCDGAATAALTGIYDEVPITAHSSDLAILTEQYPTLNWVSNAQVTQSNNLYSTAGVSNATEGTLGVIRALFGRETAQELAEKINYPYSMAGLKRIPLYFNASDKVQILKKVAFSRNKKLGFFLTESISEFHLAALLDTYSRTFPKEINSFSKDGKPVMSLNGLVLIPTAGERDFDEIHILGGETRVQELDATSGRVITHDFTDGYIFDYSLSKIEEEYGIRFRNTTQKLLDYGNRQD
jgi:transcriptional regulator GlxA family with amidase domain